MAGTVDVRTYDLAIIIDPISFGPVKAAGDIDRGEAARGIEEAVGEPLAVEVRPNNLSAIVDPDRGGTKGEYGAWKIDRGEVARGIEEAMSRSIGILVRPYDLAAIVDPGGAGTKGSGEGDRSEVTNGIEQARWPHDLAAIVDAVVRVGADDGDIERGDVASRIQEAIVGGCTLAEGNVAPDANDLAAVVDPVRPRSYDKWEIVAGKIDRGERVSHIRPSGLHAAENKYAEQEQ